MQTYQIAHPVFEVYISILPNKNNNQIRLIGHDIGVIIIDN